MDSSIPISGRRNAVLDVFRGMTVFLMIVVNSPGSGATPFSPLLHAEWDGFTLTDLVFPSFLFAVGNALSFTQSKWQLLTRQAVLIGVLRRTLLIFSIGVLLTWVCTTYWNADGEVVIGGWDSLRLMAVLQRIALSYCLAAVIILYFSVRGTTYLALALLALYWLLLYWFGDTGAPFTPEGNAVRKLDLLLLGEAHMYREHNVVFDPEGLLSTLPATATVLGGYLAARFIQHGGNNFKTTALLLLISNLMMVAALWWNLSFPINKKLWTSPFVLLSGGIDLAVLGSLIYALDILHINTGMSFFMVLGKNPLIIYILSCLLGVLMLMPMFCGTGFYEWINLKIFQVWAPGPLGSLLFAIFFALICWGVAWMLDRYKVYLRV